MLTTTSLNNPTFAKRVRRSLWLAHLQALKTNQKAVSFTHNRKGDSVLVCQVNHQGVDIAFNKGCKDMTDSVKKIYQFVLDKAQAYA